MNKETRLRELFSGWLEGRLGAVKQEEWTVLLADPELDAIRQRLIESYYDDPAVDQVMSPEDADALFQAILGRQGRVERAPRLGTGEKEPGGGKRLPGEVVARMPYYRRMPFYGTAAAAVVLLIISVWVLLYYRRPQQATAPVAVNVFKNDVRPGGNHAVLTLGNGSTVILDSAGKGSLASQGGASVTKTDSANLVYRGGERLAGQDRAGGDVSVAVYNTLSTPAGGQYRLTLADGTKVWLNALSSIRYPAAFTGGDRAVELTGEAYFEVARNSSKPFMVKVNGMDVRVLGTSFDVNAYGDEAMVKTSLIEGAVRVDRGNASLELRPGQQAQSGAGTPPMLVKDADVEEAIAWKNGFFSFEDADVKTVMRVLSRWYDIRVHYEGAEPKTTFGGRMGRDLNLTQVLTELSNSGVHFKLEGKDLTVYP